MTAPSKVSGAPRNAVHLRDVLKSRRAEARKFAISDGAPVEVVESGPSVPARVATLASRVTIRPILAAGSYVPTLPWPWGLIDLAARALLPASATVRETVKLANASAQLDISSSSRGLLIPRMDSNAVKAIVSPATGLMVYDTSRNELMVNTGTAVLANWQNLVATSGWQLGGNNVTASQIGLARSRN